MSQMVFSIMILLQQHGVMVPDCDYLMEEEIDEICSVKCRFVQHEMRYDRYPQSFDDLQEGKRKGVR